MCGYTGTHRKRGFQLSYRLFYLRVRHRSIVAPSSPALSIVAALFLANTGATICTEQGCNFAGRMLFVDCWDMPGHLIRLGRSSALGRHSRMEDEGMLGLEDGRTKFQKAQTSEMSGPPCRNMLATHASCIRQQIHGLLELLKSLPEEIGQDRVTPSAHGQPGSKGCRAQSDVTRPLTQTS